MVGVAGRSKACITCKKRRIACDSARPDCGQCTRSKRFCEGYDKFPVFLNKTASGWERRQHLGEVKPRSQASASKATNNGTTAIVPQQIESVSSVWYEQLVSQFLWLYGVRDAPTSREALPLAFLSLAAQMTAPSSLLQLSLRALSTTRIARRSNDARLLASGIQTYGQALGELQKALYDPNRMYGEDTLIAVKVFVIHEGYESTSNNIEAWNAHMSAVTRLIVMRCLRGPQSPIAQAIVEEHRYPAMIQSIAGHQRNPMGDAKWRAGNLGPSSFNDAQRLFDIGFDVGALAEQVDQLLAESIRPEQIQQRSILENDLQQIEAGMTIWYEQLEMETPGPLFFDSPTPIDHNSDSSDLEIPLSFHSAAIAEQVTTFWAIKILSLILSMKLRSTTNPQGPPLEAVQIKELAILITRSAPYSFVGHLGQYLALRFLFPLNVARRSFAASVDRLTENVGREHAVTMDAIRYRDWCALYYTRLETEQGIGYARDLRAKGSQWQ